MNVGSLFSGIGGLDLGLERAGMTVVWQSEIDPYASRVLAKHWPNVPNLGDITTIDWSQVEPVDILAGGFPCQPVSGAGKRRAQDDSRWLWPEFARAIRRLQPRIAVMENVPGLLVRGIDIVLGDLHRMGFDATWSIVPACALGAPHPRERLFIVAHPSGLRLDPWWSEQPLPRAWVDGSLPMGWTVEPDVGRVAHGIPNRVDRLRCLGNAVVPQVAEWVGQRIMKAAA